MFKQLEMAPPDAIMGLVEAFKKDPNPNKVNLSVGVYKDENGNTPVFEAVKEAERRILADEKTKSYFPIDGSPEYAQVVKDLLFGAGSEISRRAVTVHTPGGTGGLRVAGDFLKKVKPGSCLWLSKPTWPNHKGVFGSVGLEIEEYPYFDPKTNSLDFPAMLGALQNIPEGDVVVLHGCCHNPTGVDPTPEQWAQIAEVLSARGLLPLVDFAYQGLAEGLREDAAGVEILSKLVSDMLIASSFSKNFGLYNERVGALTLVASEASQAEAALSHIKRCVRTNYSNPPAHGAQIVTTILKSDELKPQWEQEVADMRARIHHMRARFVEELQARGVQSDFSFIQRQHGMFSFTGLDKEQVKTLREKYSIYIVETGGRVNVAGMTEKNIPVLCQALAEVL